MTAFQDGSDNYAKGTGCLSLPIRLGQSSWQSDLSAARRSTFRGQALCLENCSAPLPRCVVRRPLGANAGGVGSSVSILFCIADEAQQIANRAAILEPPVLRAADLYQLTETIAPVTRVLHPASRSRRRSQPGSCRWPLVWPRSWPLCCNSLASPVMVLRQRDTQ
jgi:hypothetical protein